MRFLTKIMNFLRSPQGRRLTDQGRRMASDRRSRRPGGGGGLLSRLRGR